MPKYSVWSYQSRTIAWLLPNSGKSVMRSTHSTNHGPSSKATTAARDGSDGVSSATRGFGASTTTISV